MSEKTEWPLTDADRERLAPVIEETDLPVCVTTAYMLVDESYIAQAGWAAGWWPRQRRVLLLEAAFEHATDEQLRGLLARSIGRHEGYHNLISKCLKTSIIVLGLVVCLGAYWLLAPTWGITGLVEAGLFGMVGAVILLPIETLASAAFSRWTEYDACRRGARLLGRTEPLEALYEPRADASYASWWHELVCSTPHPADLIVCLDALDVGNDGDER